MTLHGSEFFELPDTPDYYCRLQEITEDRIAVIEVFKTNVGGKRYLVHIEDVILIKCPILWRAPVFELTSGVELLELARTVNDDRFRKLSDSDLLAHYFLYRIGELSFADHEDAMYILAGKVVVQSKTRKDKRN